MKTLEQLQNENIPIATMEVIGIEMKLKEDTPEGREILKKNKAALAEYLSGFVFNVEAKCPRCGSKLTGIFGSFTWGLQHGEGFCSNYDYGDEGERIRCGYPIRMYHKIDNGDDVGLSMTYPLPYHPSVLTSESEKAVQP